MIDLRVLALTAGTSFGTWPFFQGVSGYGGTAAAAWMAISTIVVTAPLAYMGWYTSVKADGSFAMLMLGGVIQTIGIVAMAMLADQATSAAERSQAMALAFVVNACVPVLVFFVAQMHAAYVKTGSFAGIVGQINRYDMVGMLGVVVVVYCLTRPR